MFTRLTAIVLLTAAFLSTASTTFAGITIRVHEKPVVTSRQIRLADIAEVSGSGVSYASLAGAVDLEPIPDGKSSVTITRSYLQIRLMLAGWRKDEMSIEGPDVIEVRYDEPTPLNDADIEKAASATMQRILGAVPEDLSVRLVGPFVHALSKDLREERSLRVEVSAPSRISLGRTSLDVRLWKGPNLVERRSAPFDIRRRHRVAILRTSMDRDTTISATNVQFENRFLDTTADEPTEDEIVGMNVRTRLNSGDILRMQDLTKRQPRELGAVIKRRDKVQVTAINGPLRIQMTGAEALEDGRIGEFILLLNTSTNKKITGRVVDAGHVEMRLR